MVSESPRITRLYTLLKILCRLAQSNSPLTSECIARAITTQPGQRRLLLDDRSFNDGTDGDPSFSAGLDKSGSYSGGIVFGEDTASNPMDEDSDQVGGRGLERSEHDSSQQRAVGLSTSDDSTSDIFTDGKAAAHSKDIDRSTDRSDGAHVLYIQMSLYPMTLAQYLLPSSPPNDNTKPRHCYHLLPSLRLLLAILTGLQYIHANHLVHRDIKPGNIFLSHPKMMPDTGYCDVSCYSCDRRGEEVFNRWLNPRIGDFGLVAQLAKEGLLDDAASCKPDGDSHKPVGTAYYRPPKWRGVHDSTTSSSSSSASPIDEKVDIFALGVVFTEMLWRCGTAMERVDMLKGLQRGSLPSGLRHKLEAEGFGVPVVEEVFTLVNAMVDPNPFERWTGERVKGTVEGLLGRLSSEIH